MSVDLKAVPPWKQALIEKKRRQDHDDKRSPNKEADQISNFPTWKRDILTKKHHTKNSLVFLSERPTQSHSQSVSNKDLKGSDSAHLPLTSSQSYSESSEHENEKQNKENTSNGEQEHINSVVENPWLRADSAYSRKKSKTNRYSDPMSDIQLNHVSNNHSWSETDGVHDTHNNIEVSDDVFKEEVTYGRGFVHKLLQRFSHMSSTNEEEEKNKLRKPHSGRISRSSENLLDDKAGRRSPRAFSPSSHYNSSLSPRSPTRSRSSDSLPSPRSLTNEIVDTSSSGNKMGYADKAALSTSKTISQEHGNEYHADISDDSGLNSEDIQDQTDNNENNNLPKNIVSSTRNVFENFISAKPYKKPAPVSPRGHTSKSVHSLIAIDNLGRDDEGASTFETLPSSPPVIENESKNGIDISSSGYVSSSAVSSAKKSPDETTKTRSKYFEGVSKTRNKSPRDSNEINISSTVSDSKTTHDKNANEMNYSPGKNINKSEKVEVQTPSSNSYGIKLKQTYTTPSSNLPPSSKSPSFQSHSGVNGHLSNSVSDTVSSPVENLYLGSIKKRKAPSPPNQTGSGPKADNSKKHVTSITLDNSKSSVIKNSQDKPDHVTNVKVTSSGVSKSYNYSGSQKIKTEPVNKKSEASRHNLSLNLNNVETKQVVSSRQVKENPASVIYNTRNKKPKFKVPTAAGPGSLLIRPASNMVHGKNAQFASLEFKYKDIKKGNFAPAKNIPAYYDDYSDESSDEDIPVTNIDDVIAESPTVTNGNSVTVSKKSKGKKYDFEGQCVIAEKSSLKTRKIKLNIQFADHATQTYEYPSQQSLLDSMPAELGDFDHPDTVYNAVSTPSDEEIPDMEEPTSTLKSTPGMGSGGTLAGYQTKMQVEFNFGMNPMDEDVNPPPPSRSSSNTQVNPGTTNSIIKPADEEETFQWSENKTSDLLF